MVNKCGVQKCDLSYDSEKKKLQPKHEGRSLIKFQKHSVNPRDDWKPSEKRSIIICKIAFQTQGHYKRKYRF